MADIDAASERKKNLWTWVAVTFWAGFVVWAIAGRDPAVGKGGAKPPAHAAQSTTPSPTKPSRSLPAEPPPATPLMDPSQAAAAPSDREPPSVFLAPPGPIKLRREKAAKCGVAMLSPTKFKHEVEASIGQPTAIDSYIAEAEWGAVLISCIRANPTPPDEELIAVADLMLQNVRKAAGWTVVRERNVRVGKHAATEIDATATSGPIPFTRWRVFVVGDVIHVHTLMLQYDPTAVPKLDVLLDSAQLNKKAGRGTSRPVDAAWAPGWSSSPSWNPSTILPPVNTGGDVYVRGHVKSDGTYVRPHTRRSPRR